MFRISITDENSGEVLLERRSKAIQCSILDPLGEDVTACVFSKRVSLDELARTLEGSLRTVKASKKRFPSLFWRILRCKFHYAEEKENVS